MVYEQQREELSKGIAEALLYLARKKEYPLHPFVGLLGFTEGIKDCGVKVDLDAKSKKAKFHLNIDVSGIKYYVPVEKEYSHLIAGSGSVPGSPDAFFDSAMDLLSASEVSLYDNYGVGLTDEQSKSLTVNFSARCSSFMDAMNNIWREYFEKYYENVLVSVDGKVPYLVGSKILPTILDEERIEEYVEICRDDVNDDREMAGFQWYVNDLFFRELAISKGYPQQAVLRKKDYNLVQTFVHGNNITWRNLERLIV